MTLDEHALARNDDDPDHRILDGQRYDKIGHEPYTRIDGSHTQLAVWQSHCAECGAPFQFRAPARKRKLIPNRRCDRHKRPGVRVRAVQA